MDYNLVTLTENLVLIKIVCLEWEYIWSVELLTGKSWCACSSFCLLINVLIVTHTTLTCGRFPIFGCMKNLNFSFSDNTNALFHFSQSAIFSSYTTLLKFFFADLLKNPVTTSTGIVQVNQADLNLFRAKFNAFSAGRLPLLIKFMIIIISAS